MSDLHFPCELIDDGTGIEQHAYQAHCRCSNMDPEEDHNSDAFFVFWDPQTNPSHLHIQCIDCWQTFCPYQQCVPPPTVSNVLIEGPDL